MSDSTTDRLRQLVGRIQGLPTLPQILSSMNRLMTNPRTSAKEVAQLISSDPAITSKVLRVVNSSFYGFPNRISTVTHAIVILGFNTARSIVLSTSIFDALKKPETTGGFDRLAFWRHSIATGAVTRVVGRRAGFAAMEEFFLAGLLHDVGKIVLDSYFPAEFARIQAAVREKDAAMVDVEPEILGGVTHAQIGGWLLEKWSLSRGLVDSVAHHHNPALAGENIKAAAVVHLGDILARALCIGSGGDRRMPPFSDAAWSALGIDPAAIPDILREGAEEAERAMVFLEFAR
ncbi:MAG: HDOD domain-containing protein [Candidatus Brocadiae bacterium]|nr:HDOD domain-containing protein [Candidatus Brocadiia bacterium]